MNWNFPLVIPVSGGKESSIKASKCMEARIARVLKQAKPEPVLRERLIWYRRVLSDRVPVHPVHDAAPPLARPRNVTRLVRATKGFDGH